MIDARFPISAEQIELVVVEFYARVRNNPALGPIFQAHVDDWPKHEQKICKFWRNAILREHGYHGNPMQIHMAATGVKSELFVDWLDIFDQTLAELLPPDLAKSWSALAHRIGRGLRYGLETYETPKSDVPIIRID